MNEQRSKNTCGCGHEARYHFDDGKGRVLCRATYDCDCGVELPSSNEMIWRLEDAAQLLERDGAYESASWVRGAAKRLAPEPPAGTLEARFGGLVRMCEHYFGIEPQPFSSQGPETRIAEAMARAAQPPPADLLDLLKIMEQALMEVRHAQEVGANWYTRGESGLYQQVSMWVRKGFTAVNAARAALTKPAAPVEGSKYSDQCVACDTPTVCAQKGCGKQAREDQAAAETSARRAHVDLRVPGCDCAGCSVI